MDATQDFQLEELRIDPATGEVAGPCGREQLDPKVMGVLVYMAQHAGQVVSRDELLAQLWPNSVVTDDALSRCFYELRRHLAQAGGSERYKSMLETLPKRGYRLNTPISLPPDQTEVRRPGAPARPWILLAVAVCAAAALAIFVSRRGMHSPPQSPPPVAVAPATPAAVAASIAVLPFVDMSAGQDQAWLADGISEEVLNRLAQSGSLRVIARTSSFSFRDRPVDIREIATSLGVSHVLEGSVRRDGDHVRITAQLIAAADGSHLWSGTLDRELGDLFAVQDEIATSVATALDATLAGKAAHREAPVSAAALERFMQGEFFYNRRAPGDDARAAGYYEQAVAIEPRYARAWAALAGAYNLLANTGGPTASKWIVRQGEAAHEAVELDPGLAVAQARLAQYYYNVPDRARADEHSRKALALDPDDPLVMGFAGSRAMVRGDLDEALQIQRKLVAYDPLSVARRGNLGAVLFATGQLEEALAELHKVLELSPQDGSREAVDVVRILVKMGRYDEAYSAIARVPPDMRDYGLALLHGAPGRRAEADAALARLNARTGGVDGLRLAEAWALRGRHDEAFAALARASDALTRSGQGASARVWDFQTELSLSPFLKPLHADARWAALMRTGPR